MNTAGKLSSKNRLIKKESFLCISCKIKASTDTCHNLNSTTYQSICIERPLTHSYFSTSPVIWYTLYIITHTFGFLTYNSSVLLMLRDNRLPISETNSWGFIESIHKKNESDETALLQEIENETSLKLVSLQLLSTLSYNDEKKHIYHAVLTGDDLNSITRGEGKNLDFFSLSALNQLPLEHSLKMFFEENKVTVEKILHT